MFNSSFSWDFIYCHSMGFNLTTLLRLVPDERARTVGMYSLSGKPSYRQISLSLEAARLDVIMSVSLWFFCDRHLGRAVSDVFVKFQNDWKSLKPNLVASGSNIVMVRYWFVTYRSQMHLCTMSTNQHDDKILWDNWMQVQINKSTLYTMQSKATHNGYTTTSIKQG